MKLPKGYEVVEIAKVKGGDGVLFELRRGDRVVTCSAIVARIELKAKLDAERRAA